MSKKQTAAAAALINSTMPLPTSFMKQHHTNGVLTLPLPVAGYLYSRGSVDAVSTFICAQIVDAMHVQYPAPVIVEGIGSFGGSTAFQRLPHRTVAELTKRYDLAACTTRCPEHGDAATVDVCHGIPRSLGGNLTRANLSVDCAACNRRKSNSIDICAYIRLCAYTLTIDVSERAMREYTN